MTAPRPLAVAHRPGPLITHSGLANRTPLVLQTRSSDNRSVS